MNSALARGLVPTALVAAVLVGAAAFAACSKTSPEPPAEKASASPTSDPPSPAASATGPSTAGRPALPGDTPGGGGPDDVAWEAPAAWPSAPNANTMRKATYKVPKAAGDAEDAELTVSAASGGVEPNVKRWAGQFAGAEPKTEQKTVNSLKVTIVEIKGTYTSGGPMMGGSGTPKEKQMLLGAIVDGGERQHFFKMTGPEKTVTAAKKDFDKLVASLRAK